jgi:hypothetical protein
MIRQLFVALSVIGLLTYVSPAVAITVDGIVYDESGATIESANVWIVHDLGISSGETSATGTFSFADLTAGEIDLVIYKEGYALGGATAPLSDDASLEIALLPAATAVARVVGPDHAPLGGARLRFAVLDDELRVRFEELSELGLPSIRSGSDGKMEIPWARPGGFVSLVVSHSRYADGALPYWPVGEATATVKIPEGAELRGRIYRPDGIGTNGSRVDVFAASGLMERVFTTVRTDAEGFYHVRLPLGSYRVRAHHSEFVSPPPPRADLRFKGSDALVNISLESASTIEGRVLDQAGAGMPGIAVAYWMDGLPQQSTLTSAEGLYRLRVPLGEGTVRVKSPPGYMRDDPIDAIAKLSTAMDLTVDPVLLRELPVIRGVVEDVDGARVPYAVIQAKNLGMPVWQLTDENGAFEIRLAFEPSNPNVLFTAQHPRRFQKTEFEVAWRNREPATPRLERFEANLTDCDPDRVVNNVDALRGESAPPWACTAWLQSPVRDEDTGEPQLQLDDLQGKVVVLTLWGGFDNSGPGYIWMEWLNTLHAMFQEDDQVSFVAVHDGVSEPGAVGEYVNQFSIKYAVGVDGENETFDRYDTNGIPQTFLIDKQGVLRYYDVRGRLLELIKSLRNEA